MMRKEYRAWKKPVFLSAAMSVKIYIFYIYYLKIHEC